MRLPSRHLDEEMDRIEESILAAPGPKSLPQVLTIKRALLHLRRIVAPQRETLNRLARDEFKAIPGDERVCTTSWKACATSPPAPWTPTSR